MQDIRVEEPFDKNIMLNYHVRVGNDPDSLDDYEYCDGSPYQDIEQDPNNDRSSVGYEIWCNKAGKYVVISKDYGEFDDYSVTLCDVAIYSDFGQVQAQSVISANEAIELASQSHNAYLD